MQCGPRKCGPYYNLKSWNVVPSPLAGGLRRSQGQDEGKENHSQLIKQMKRMSHPMGNQLNPSRRTPVRAFNLLSKYFWPMCARPCDLA